MSRERRKVFLAVTVIGAVMVAIAVIAVVSGQVMGFVTPKRSGAFNEARQFIGNNALLQGKIGPISKVHLP